MHGGGRVEEVQFEVEYDKYELFVLAIVSEEVVEWRTDTQRYREKYPPTTPYQQFEANCESVAVTERF